MKQDTYKLWQVVLIPLFFIEGSFALGHRLGWDWTTYGLFYFSSLAGVMIQLWMISHDVLILGRRIINDTVYDDEPEPAPKEKPVKQYPNLNPEFALDTSGVEINLEMLLAQAILKEFDIDSRVKVSGDVWLDTWRKIGGKGKQDLYTVFNEWEGMGALERINKNTANSAWFVPTRSPLWKIAKGKK